MTVKYPYAHFDGLTGRIRQFSSSAFRADDLDCAEIIDPPEDYLHGDWQVDLATFEAGTCRLKPLGV